MIVRNTSPNAEVCTVSRVLLVLPMVLCVLAVAAVAVLGVMAASAGSAFAQGGAVKDAVGAAEGPPGVALIIAEFGNDIPR